MLESLIDPFIFPFMIRGFLAVVIVGIVCAVIGTYIVLRGMAFFGDALAHTILPGIAVGYLIGGGAQGPIFIGGMVAAILSSIAIGEVGRRSQIREDTAIGIIFAGMFALGIALISTVRSYARDLAHFMFGDVLGVSNNDLLITSILGAVVLITIIIFYKEFMLISFDPMLATTLNIPINFLNNLLLILVAVTIVITIQTVGVALMVAMLVTPAATASMLTKRLHYMMIIGSLIAVFSGIIGLYASFYLNVSSGAAIVLVCTACFAFVWATLGIRQRV